MNTGGAKQEQNIKEQTEGLEEVLEVLLMNIDNLVERNPKPTAGESKGADRPDNVFDEIISNLRHCRSQVREAIEKVQVGISRKVQ